MNNQEQLNKKINEIKEKYKDKSNDKNYFLCKLAMTNPNDFKYIMNHVSEKEILEEERKLKLQDVTDRAIDHAKEQTWIYRE
jgi:hypothetical protein